MTATFPNPQKKITVASRLKEIKEALLFTKYINYGYILSSSDEAKNQYCFESYKFLRDGVLVDINLLDNSGSATEINIEIRRMAGAFEKDRQVKQANKHLTDFEAILTQILKLTPEQKQKYVGTLASTEPEKGLKKYTCAGCKKLFYADPKVTLVAICPHCKSRSSLSKEDGGSGWGQLISLVFQVTTMFRKGRE